MPCTFKSGLVHIATLKNYIQGRGYPTSSPKIPGFMQDHHSFSWNGIGQGQDVYVFKSSKPGIYFLPPEPCDEDESYLPYRLEVTVQLCPGWEFKSIYPWAVVESCDNSATAKWNVVVNSRGETTSATAKEKYVGKISWETSLKTSHLPRPPKSIRLNPAGQILTPENSVVLHRDHVLRTEHNYLHAVLRGQLRLPQEIVHNFQLYFIETFGGEIRRWSRRYSIAISFVPQSDIEGATALTITPQPAATVRILMLFSAVDNSGTSQKWKSWTGQRRSLKCALAIKNWAVITGIRTKALSEGTKFRAIEWDVMEVSARLVLPKKPKLEAE